MGLFAAGAMVGAAVTLLYAPARGGDTRAYVARTVKNGRDRARNAARAGRAAFDRQRVRFDQALRSPGPATAPAPGTAWSAPGDTGRADM
jgi:hypothetical protein